MSEKKNIVMLLGAGASQGAGLPGTQELSAMVRKSLSEEGDLFLDYSNNFSISRPHESAPEEADTVAVVRQGYHALRSEFNEYTSFLEKVDGEWQNRIREADWDFEFIAYLADLLSAPNKHLRKNVFANATRFKISKANEGFSTAQEISGKWWPEPWGPLYSAVRDVTLTTVAQAESESNAIPLYRDLASDLDACSYDMFTLNYDSVMENSFHEATTGSSHVDDGFDARGERQMIWRGHYRDDASIRIYHLHGDWRWASEGRVDGLLVKNKVKDFPYTPPLMEALMNPSEVISTRGDEPILVFGKYEKPFAYLREPFLFLMHEFYRRLKQADAVVVVGYSFGDEGITQYLKEWLNGSDKRKLVLVDPNATTLLKTVWRVGGIFIDPSHSRVIPLDCSAEESGLWNKVKEVMAT